MDPGQHKENSWLRGGYRPFDTRERQLGKGRTGPFKVTLRGLLGGDSLGDGMTGARPADMDRYHCWVFRSIVTDDSGRT